MKRIMSVILSLAMLATMLILPGVAVAEEAGIITYSMEGIDINEGQKARFVVSVTDGTKYIALYEEEGTEPLHVWDAHNYAAMDNGSLKFFVMHPITEAVDRRYVFKASADGVSFVGDKAIDVTTAEGEAPVTATGDPEVASVSNTAGAGVAVHTQIANRVRTSDNARYLGLFSEAGELLYCWDAETYGSINYGSMNWYVFYRMDTVGKFQKPVFRASVDGENWGPEKMAMITINPADLSAETQYLGDWYVQTTNTKLTLNADGSAILTKAGETIESGWIVEYGDAVIGDTVFVLGEDGMLVADEGGTEMIFSRNNPFAFVDMPYDPLPGEDFWHDADYARLDAYQGYELNLILPREIDGTQLTMIGGGMMNRASYGDDYDVELPVRSLVIPETYTQIPSYAFWNCDTLETVICYAPIEKLEDGTFNGCTSLREVVFVNGVREIGSRVFDGCTSLETVYLGGFVENVSEYAFEGSGFELSKCLTNPADMPDVDALLAAVKSDPMPAPEPEIAVPIGEEGAAFFGTWSAETMDMGGEIYNVADMGMVMDLTLNADGTCAMYDGETTDAAVWTLSDGVACIDGMVMTLTDEGKLCMEEEGMKMFFGKAGDEAQTSEGGDVNSVDAQPIGEEGAAFFGTWSAETMDMGGEIYNVADMGMVMDLTLNADGTCAMYDGETTDVAVWTLSDGVAQIDTMTLSLTDDGKLCMEEEGIKMFFGKIELSDVYMVGYYYSEYMGLWYGISMFDGTDTYDLAAMGLDVTLELRDDGTAVLNMGGEAEEVTWQGDDSGLTIDTMAFTLQADGSLLMEEDGMSMTFSQEEPVATVPTESDLTAYASYLGTWYCNLVEDGDMKINPADWDMSITLTLNEDGSALIATDDDMQSLSWRASEDGILVDTILVTMQEDGTLIASDDGTIMIFGRTPAMLAPTQETTPEPTQEPDSEENGLNEDLMRYVGVWHACYVHTDGLTGDMRGMGLNITLALNADGTGTIDFPKLENHLWYPGEEYLEYGTVYFGDGNDGFAMPLTILDDGYMRYGTELGGYMIFSQDENAVWQPETSENVVPAATETPVITQPAETPGDLPTDMIPAEERMEVKYSCLGAMVEGYPMDVAMLGGEYSMIFHEDGTMDLVIVGMEIPGGLTWTQRTETNEKGESAQAFVINYYGQDLIAYWTDTGFELNYFDSMLMVFENEETTEALFAEGITWQEKYAERHAQ